ncbi:male accessory gland serine protease inhibitor-like [Eupeodes corollae]|uniref:male accessory gland serine protease inhibitor-like n=1 Tax=Eupeodes corollae TaxID=290404 RepID=UPI00248F56C0|nr:male accessory gland serine protease inhibitor-like [Eupeodes corollae]
MKKIEMRLCVILYQSLAPGYLIYFLKKKGKTKTSNMKLILGIILTIFVLVTMIGAEKPAACLQPHSKDGDAIKRCRAFFRSWTYNAEEGKCIEFGYGGCGGNENRFHSLKACEDLCVN